jgi:hypothetical protein
VIRPVTLVTGLLMLGSGAWLFVVKHRAGTLDHKIGGVTAQIRSSEQRIRVLRAEWALETDPNRLARLAAMFMPQLKPMKPDQLVSWQQLADVLPPPGAELPHLPLPPPLPGDLSRAPSSAAVATAAAPETVALATIPPSVPPRSSSKPRSVATVSQTALAVPARHLAAPHPIVRPAKSRRAAAPAQHAAVVVHQTVGRRHDVAAGSSRSAIAATARRPQTLGASVLAPRRADRPAGARVISITASDAVPSRPPAPAPSTRIDSPATRGASVFGDYGAGLAPPRPAGGVAP